MKIKVHVAYVETYEVNDEVFQTLYNTHKNDPFDQAPAEVYEEAVKQIENLCGLPSWDETIQDEKHISGVYAEDGVAILEF